MSEVGPDGRPGGDAGRCPSCGARVVAGQDWCSLCLQPLGARAPVETSGEPDVLDGTGDLLQERSTAPEEPGPRGPGSPEAAGPPGASAAGLDPLVAEAMLAELAATTAAERPLARGPLARASRSTRLALGCGAAVVLIGLLVLVLTLLGLLL